MWWDWVMSKVQSYAWEREHPHTGGGGGFETLFRLSLVLMLALSVGHWERIGGWLRVWVESAFGGGGGGGF